MRSLRLSEKIIYCTVRLKCQSSNETIFGTGFIFKFFRNKENSYPVIVTNKHIVKEAANITFYLNRADANNWPIHVDPIEIPLSLELQKQIIYHPKTDIDIAILPIGNIINKSLEYGDRPFYTAIDYTTIPKGEKWDELHALEDVLVIGYPNNLEDDVNKLPISVIGNTATHPSIDFYGRKEFLINANLYHGSSGSPVFLLDDDFYGKSRQFQEGDDKVKLLGVLYGGYSHPIYERDLSNGIEDKQTNYVSPMNICNVIRSTAIKDFEPIMREKIKILETGF
jgi:hypothetical protein